MDTKKIGRFIAAKRKEKNLTQMQLAEKLGVTNKTISRWENGNYMPDLSLLIPLSEVLGVDVNDLLNGECVEHEKTNVVNYMEHYEKMIKQKRKEWLQNTALISIIVIAFMAVLYFSVSTSAGILHGDMEQWKSYIQSQGGVIMGEMLKYTFWVVIIVAAIAIFEFCFAFYYKFQEKKMNQLEGIVTGEITGLLRSRLFKNDIYGEIPGGVIIGWGVAQGEQAWGGTLKLRIPPWFPCIKYEVNGVEYQKLVGEGVWKDTWEIGQTVTILYKPDTPGICMIEGDPSYRTKMKMSAITATVLSVMCVIGIVIIVVIL